MSPTERPLLRSIIIKLGNPTTDRDPSWDFSFPELESREEETEPEGVRGVSEESVSRVLEIVMSFEKCSIRLKNGSTADISRARPSDAQEQLSFVELVSGETDNLTFGRGEFDLSLAQEEQFLHDMSDPAKGGFWIARIEGVLVGNVIARRSTRTRLRHAAELSICIAKKHWGVGLGKRLCEFVADACKSIGVERLALTVRSDNARAIRLYETLGYLHEGRLGRALKVGNDYVDLLAMAKHLL